MADFQRLGFDRLSQNIARAVNSPSGGLVTGDITRGDVVTIELSNSASGSAQVKSRRTGAVLIDSTVTGSDYQGHTIEGTTLTINYSTATSGAVSFWVW